MKQEERDPLSLEQVEWSLWCLLMCHCERCGAFYDLSVFDPIMEQSPIECAKVVAPLVHAQGWSAPQEFELLCPACTKRAAAR